MNARGRIAVAGATGRLGRHIVDVLEERGHEVVPMSRSLGVDVVTAEGLTEALAGVETVIDAASHPTPEQGPATDFFVALSWNLHQLGARAVEDEMEETTFPDERLELIFTCCHPALGLEAQVALTLRALGGLTTEEIARAFIVPEETMKRRLTRAKRKIKDAGIPFSVPAEHLLPQRLAAVLAVVYLVFNEGYGGRVDLAAEAIRLGEALAELMPDEPEAHGLNALMLLDDARRDARFADGELVLLGDQDRSRWDAAKITRGREALDRAFALRGRGAYVVQAAIASLHMEEHRDWQEIAGLYGELVRMTGSAVVELNRAIAVAEVAGPEAGLALVDRIDLDGYQYFHSTRADLLRRLDRADEARTEYESALELAHSEPERRFLQRRLADVGA